MIKKECKYYPCHEKLEDCTYCYCPVFPCYDTKLGREIIHDTLREPCWDCSPCDLFHQAKVVKAIEMFHKKEK